MSGESDELWVESEDKEFREWIADQGLDAQERKLWNFHRWLRQETDLNSGTIVDYRKYVAEILDDQGNLGVDPEELKNEHRKAACNKFIEFREISRTDHSSSKD